MSLVSIPFTFTVGATIIASQHNSNFSIIYADYNGNIDNTNISASASIADTKLAQITTAGKVSGAALASLGSIPSGGGILPAKNGGTGADMSAALIGALPYFSATAVMSALAAGTSGQVIVSGGAGAPSWANALASVSDYGTSQSASTARQATALKIAYGYISSISSGSSVNLSNLPFTSSSSFIVICSCGTPPTLSDEATGMIAGHGTSGSAAIIYNTDNQSKDAFWLAIGI